MNKYTIDKPLLIYSCKRCNRPLTYKGAFLYCEHCKKRRNVKTAFWMNYRSGIEFVTKKELTKEILQDKDDLSEPW